jgi:hypothetical protein
VSKDVLRLGSGSLQIGQIEKIRGTRGGRPNLSRSGWDVWAYCLICVERAARPSGKFPVKFQGKGVQIIPMDSPYKWSATLAFASRPGEDTYRWREVAFWRPQPAFVGANPNEPFGLPADNTDFDAALSNVAGLVNIAFGPKAIDAEDEQDFQRRWLFLLSKAATGSLQKPSSMPIPSNYFQ